MEDNNGSSLILENRYLIASLKSKDLAFPASLVQDILTLERSQILVLPFYNSAILGVIHYQNQIIPLISTQQILGIADKTLLQSNLTAVRLNDLAEHLEGVALIVDRMNKSLTAEELSREHKFELTDIPEEIWNLQLQR